jgi:hypothetical protein
MHATAADATARKRRFMPFSSMTVGLQELVGKSRSWRRSMHDNAYPLAGETPRRKSIEWLPPLSSKLYLLDLPPLLRATLHLL